MSCDISTRSRTAPAVPRAQRTLHARRSGAPMLGISFSKLVNVRLCMVCCGADCVLWRRLCAACASYARTNPPVPITTPLPKPHTPAALSAPPACHIHLHGDPCLFIRRPRHDPRRLTSHKPKKGAQVRRSEAHIESHKAERRHDDCLLGTAHHRFDRPPRATLHFALARSLAR